VGPTVTKNGCKGLRFILTQMKQILHQNEPYIYLNFIIPEKYEPPITLLTPSAVLSPRSLTSSLKSSRHTPGTPTLSNHAPKMSSSKTDILHSNTEYMVTSSTLHFTDNQTVTAAYPFIPLKSTNLTYTDPTDSLDKLRKREYYIKELTLL
jgi:hypothetical protein